MKKGGEEEDKEEEEGGEREGGGEGEVEEAGAHARCRVRSKSRPQSSVGWQWVRYHSAFGFARHDSTSETVAWDKKEQRRMEKAMRNSSWPSGNADGHHEPFLPML